MNAEEACLEVLKRISRNYNDDMAKIEQFDIFFHALRKDGDFAAASMWSSEEGVKRDFAVNTGGKSRHEKAAFLYSRKS